MNKRLDKSNDRECEVPAKRPRYSVQTTYATNGKTASGKDAKAEDIWGCDFGEEDIQEMDFIASQVSIQDNVCSQKPAVQLSQAKSNGPSTSKGIFNVNDGNRFQASLQSHHFHLEKGRLANLNDVSMISTVEDYREFEKKMIGNVHNSTFQFKATQESECSKELEKLRAEWNKLMRDFIAKDGEVSNLRDRLHETEQRMETIRAEKARIIEEQKSQHKNEIGFISKEKEALKTQLDMKALEIGNLMERCKLLEGGQIKLTEPHVVNANFLMNKSKLNTSVNRTPTSKHSRLQDNSAQTDGRSKFSSVIRICNSYCALERIPESIYDLSRAEERIVDLHNIGNATQDSQMLHEQISHKVFENPELLRPVTTRVDGRDLTLQFILQDVASLRGKTVLELESESSIRMINKILSTARELLLNATVALERISSTIRSDELRDYSELYFDTSVSSKCVCDPEPWHSGERGVELRRVLGVVSHVTVSSTYLAEYVAGKTALCTHRDESYKLYSEQMTRYSAWSKRGEKFEMLEMFSDFISVVGTVRRSHQFSGIVCAIAMIIGNVHESVGYCESALPYVLRIFREIVSLKPLPYCYAELGKIMTIFADSMTHLQSLCLSKTSCILQNFLTQLQNYQHNPITTIDLVESLLRVMECMLHQNVVPLRIGRSDSCNHCFELMRFIIENLQEISETNLRFLENIRPSEETICYLRPICSKHSQPCLESSAVCLSKVYEGKLTRPNFWKSVRSQQLRVLKAGLIFLANLAICDPNVESQGPEIENALHLFIKNASLFEGLGDHPNINETIVRIKETFMADKPIRMEEEKGPVNRTNRKSVSPFLMNWPTDQNTLRRTDHDRSLAAINKLATE